MVSVGAWSCLHWRPQPGAQTLNGYQWTSRTPAKGSPHWPFSWTEGVAGIPRDQSQILAASPGKWSLPWACVFSLGTCPCRSPSCAGWGSAEGLVSLVSPAFRIHFIGKDFPTLFFFGYPFTVFFFFHVFASFFFFYQPLLICICHVVENLSCVYVIKCLRPCTGRPVGLAPCG